MITCLGMCNILRESAKLKGMIEKKRKVERMLKALTKSLESSP